MLKIKKITITILEIWIIFQSLMFIFVGYEQIVSWGDKESWCTESQILEPNELQVQKSVILVHGYGGSPFDYKPLAEELQKQGFFVVVPLMPDQGKETFAYKRGQFKAEHYIAWLNNIIQQETDRFKQKPYLIGFSMGATIATICAEEKVDKLILLAPFYSLPAQYDTIVMLNKLFCYILPVVPKFASGQIYSKQGRNTYSPGSFLPSSAVFRELARLVIIAKEKIPLLTTQTMIIGSTNDIVAYFPIVPKLFTNMKNSSIIDYPESNHIMLYDYAADKIIKDVIMFLQK